jgi:hypothetical protein
LAAPTLTLNIATSTAGVSSFASSSSFATSIDAALLAWAAKMARLAKSNAAPPIAFFTYNYFNIEQKHTDKRKHKTYRRRQALRASTVCLNDSGRVGDDRGAQRRC